MDGDTQRLTNWEVLRFLQLRRAATGGATRDVHSAMVASTGLQAMSGSGTNLLAQRDAIAARLSDVKWICRATHRYLMSTPAVLQTQMGISAAVDALRSNGDDASAVGSSLRLNEVQKLSLINSAATTPLLVTAVLGERLPLRPRSKLAPDDHEKVADALAEHLPTTVAGAVALHRSRSAAADVVEAALMGAGDDGDADGAAGADAEAAHAVAHMRPDLPPAVLEWQAREAEKAHAAATAGGAGSAAASAVAAAEAAASAAAATELLVVPAADDAAAGAAAADASGVGSKRRRPHAGSDAGSGASGPGAGAAAGSNAAADAASGSSAGAAGAGAGAAAAMEDDGGSSSSAARARKGAGGGGGGARKGR